MFCWNSKVSLSLICGYRWARFRENVVFIVFYWGRYRRFKGGWRECRSTVIYRVFALLRPRNIRIRYVLLKSIGQFVAPVRVSLTLISQNAGIYSVLLSPISWFGWSAGSKKVFLARRRLWKNTGRVFEGFARRFLKQKFLIFFWSCRPAGSG